MREEERNAAIPITVPRFGMLVASNLGFRNYTPPG